MPSATLIVDIHIPQARSLKDKRQLVRHVLDSCRKRYRVATSELAFHEIHQRSTLGFAAIGADATHVEEILDAVERFVWAQPELEVTSAERLWVEEP